LSKGYAPAIDTRRSRSAVRSWVISRSATGALRFGSANVSCRRPADSGGIAQNGMRRVFALGTCVPDFGRRSRYRNATEYSKAIPDKVLPGQLPRHGTFLVVEAGSPYRIRILFLSSGGVCSEPSKLTCAW